MRTRLISLILLIPASWLLFATIALLVLFMAFNIQGWIGCLVYLPLFLLLIYIVVLPKVLLTERVGALMKSARKHSKANDNESANHCYEQAMYLQEDGKRLGLSMVLKEYSHFLRKFDEFEAGVLLGRAISIQKDALKGVFNDDFSTEESCEETFEDTFKD